jgi:twitching motility two-component system response regulator PilH
MITQEEILSTILTKETSSASDTGSGNSSAPNTQSGGEATHHPSGFDADGRISVLLVEDDRSLRRFLEIVLVRAGYHVRSANDGLEAIKVALSAKVDIVITDAMMPHLSGYELCRFIRKTPPLAHLPIILLSALERVDRGEEAERVDAFLAKPVSPEELLECLAGLLVRVK